MTEIERFFDDYAAAFSRGDAGAVSALWAFPAFVVARRKRAALYEDAFRANSEALIAFYRGQGMVRAEKCVLSTEAVFDGLWVVRTADRMTDAAGAGIAAWEHAYLLSRTPDGLRAVAAMPDGELDAWQRRGTRWAAGEAPLQPPARRLIAKAAEQGVEMHRSPIRARARSFI